VNVGVRLAKLGCRRLYCRNAYHQDHFDMHFFMRVHFVAQCQNLVACQPFGYVLVRMSSLLLLFESRGAGSSLLQNCNTTAHTHPGSQTRSYQLMPCISVSTLPLDVHGGEKFHLSAPSRRNSTLQDACPKVKRVCKAYIGREQCNIEVGRLLRVSPRYLQRERH
jgi:hypothetical protein